MHEICSQRPLKTLPLTDLVRMTDHWDFFSFSLSSILLKRADEDLSVRSWQSQKETARTGSKMTHLPLQASCPKLHSLSVIPRTLSIP